MSKRPQTSNAAVNISERHGSGLAQQAKGLMVLAVIALLSGGVWFGLYITKEDPRQTLKIGAIVPSKSHINTVEGFRAGMAELGFDESSGDTFIFNGPSGRGPGLKSAINELLQKQVDIIFVATTPMTLAVKKATKDNQIPVIFGPVNDPVSARIVESLRNPGGNITGVALMESEGRRLELLKEIVPTIERVFVPFNPKNKSSMATIKQIKKTAPTLGLHLILKPVHDNAELSVAIGAIPDTADAIFMPRDSMINARLEDFGKAALKRNLPLVSASHSVTAKGALFGFGPDLFKIGKQAARLADHVLRSGNPSNHPVESAENYLFINLSTAKTIGVDIPEYILHQANRIIR